MISEIQVCIKVLKKNGIILYPTDTIWGLGCDATNIQAIQSIEQLKERKENKNFIILATSIQMLKQIVDFIPEIAIPHLQLPEKPTTIIYPTHNKAYQHLAASDGSIAVRIIKHPFCHNLINTLQKPIVSTSANKSSAQTPLSFEEIDNIIKKHVDHVVSKRFDTNNTAIPSKIIKLGFQNTLTIIRE